MLLNERQLPNEANIPNTLGGHGLLRYQCLRIPPYRSGWRIIVTAVTAVPCPSFNYFICKVKRKYIIIKKSIIKSKKPRTMGKNLRLFTIKKIHSLFREWIKPIETHSN